MNRQTRISGRVLVAAPVSPSLLSGLEERGYSYLYLPHIEEEEAARELRDCQGLITSTRVRVDAELLDQAPQLRWIGRMGSGMEIIDLEAAASRGVYCFNSPEGNAQAVAEHALGMMISLNRRITHSHLDLQLGLWRREENRGHELGSMTLGIIGMGHTGKALANLMKGFGTRVLGYDIQPRVPFPRHVERVSLQTLQSEAQIVSFHVPLDKTTHHYLNLEFIRRMAQPFILVNTSRGAVVDREALVTGLNQGMIIGACLDVWEQEPLDRMSMSSRSVYMELAARPECVFTPHIAGYSHQALERMGAVLMEKLDRWESTDPAPPESANP